MTAKSTPAEIAQRSLDAAQKRVDRAEERAGQAEMDLAAAKVEKAEAEAVRDYRKGHPALKVETADVTIDYGTVNTSNQASS